MNEIRLNTGLKAYKILDEMDNEIGVIRFRPTDNGIVYRFQDVSKALQKKYSEVVNIIETLKDSDIEDDKLIELTRELDDYCKEQIDFLFNANVSKELFSVISPTSFISDGTESYITHIIEKICPVILEEIEKNQKTKTKYSEKYKGKKIK